MGGAPLGADRSGGASRVAPDDGRAGRHRALPARFLGVDLGDVRERERLRLGGAVRLNRDLALGGGGHFLLHERAVGERDLDCSVRGEGRNVGHIQRERPRHLRVEVHLPIGHRALDRAGQAVAGLEADFIARGVAVKARPRPAE